MVFESLALKITSVFVVFFILLYLFVTRHFNYWKKRGIPYVKPLPFVGNLKSAALQTLDIGQNLKEIYDKNKNRPYIGFFSFDQPSLMINDTELVKKILVKDSQNFINRVLTADEKSNPLTAKAIFALRGQKWRHVRLSMTPIFTSGKMKKMFSIVDDCGKELAKYIEQRLAQDTTLEVKDAMARFTTDVIASCAFGIDSNSLKNPDAEFRQYLRKIFDFNAIKSFATLLISFAPNFQSFFRLKILNDDVEQFLRRTVWSTVKYRETNQIERKDFLDNMMELRKKGAAENVDDTLKIDGDDFVAQSFAFLSAGFETSSTTMSFALYELALHPDMQHRLRTEITEVLAKHDQKVTYDSIQEMTYLDMVVSETLRKYPIVPYLDRRNINDYELPAENDKGSVTLKSGTAVYIPVYALHHDPQYFPEPQVFDPNRFTEENKKDRPYFSYLPFGEGPRNCIGMRFGLMQVKTGLIHILNRYEVNPCRNTPIPIKINPKPFLLQSMGEIPLQFKEANTAMNIS